jgi:hypothetical protein
MTLIKIESIEVRRLSDDDPDLSWLDQTDKQMSEGFEEYAAKRKAEFQAGDWSMVGVQAMARIRVEGVEQKVYSGGLWGIESDSAESYFEEVGEEQLDELRSILRELHFSVEEIVANTPQKVGA